jgi:hypothetical protein
VQDEHGHAALTCTHSLERKNRKRNVTKNRNQNEARIRKNNLFIFSLGSGTKIGSEMKRKEAKKSVRLFCFITIRNIK